MSTASPADGAIVAGFEAYTTLRVTSPARHVLHVQLNRPRKLNAMNKQFWADMVRCFTQIGARRDTRAVVISGAGRAFTSGLDVMDHADVFSNSAGDDGNDEAPDTARAAFALEAFVDAYQEAFTVLERIRQPVIAAVHGACVGGGIDLITACDIRVCSDDAWFCVKEVDIGLAADVGTLQRLPHVVGNASLVREWCYTARKIASQEAFDAGLVSRRCGTPAQTIAKAEELAALIASKSPVAITGTKRCLVYARDHPNVADGLSFVRHWNMSMLQTRDLTTAMTAAMSRSTPVYSNL